MATGHVARCTRGEPTHAALQNKLDCLQTQHGPGAGKLWLCNCIRFLRGGALLPCCTACGLTATGVSWPAGTARSSQQRAGLIDPHQHSAKPVPGRCVLQAARQHQVRCLQARQCHSRGRSWLDSALSSALLGATLLWCDARSLTAQIQCLQTTALWSTQQINFAQTCSSTFCSA